MKAYSKPAIQVIRINTLEMLASSLVGTDVNTGGGYGPDGGNASNQRQWEGDVAWDNFEEKNY